MYTLLLVPLSKKLKYPQNGSEFSMKVFLEPFYPFYIWHLKHVLTAQVTISQYAGQISPEKDQFIPFF